MKIGNLTLFERMHANGTPSSTVLLAAWHWKWSVTWRWHLSWTAINSGKKGFHFMRVYKGSKGINFHCGANLPWVGSFSLVTQPNMDMRKNGIAG